MRYLQNRQQTTRLLACVWGAFLVWMSVVSLWGKAWGVEKVTIASGTCPIFDGNVERARSSALRDAYEKAIAQALGVAVYSHLEVVDNVKIRSFRSATVSGYVSGYRILSEDVTPDSIFEIVIEATVVPGTIPTDEMVPRRILTEMVLGSPAVGLVLLGDDGRMLRALEAGLSERIADYGFRLSYSKVLGDLDTEVDTLLPREGLDLAIVVRHIRNDCRTNAAGTLLEGLHTCHCAVSCTVRLCRFPERILSTTVTEIAIGSDPHIATQRCIMNLVNQLDRKVLAGIPQRVEKAEVGIRLELSECSYSDLDTLVSGFQSVPDIRGVKILEWEDDKALLEVLISPLISDASTIARTARWIFGQRLTVLRISKENLALKLRR